MDRFDTADVESENLARSTLSFATVVVLELKALYHNYLRLQLIYLPSYSRYQRTYEPTPAADDVFVGDGVSDDHRRLFVFR